MCLTAWKLPIGLPNCSRTFAYSVAVSQRPAGQPGGLGGEHRRRQIVDPLLRTAASTVGGRVGEHDAGQRAGRSRWASAVRPSRRRRWRRRAANPSPARGSSSTPAASAPSTYSAVPVAWPSCVDVEVGGQRQPGGALPGGQRLEQVRVRTRHDQRGQRRSWRPGRAPAPRRPRRPSRTGRRRCRLRRRAPRAPRRRRCPVGPGPRTARARRPGRPARRRGPPRSAPDPAAQLRTSSRAANCSSVIGRRRLRHLRHSYAFVREGRCFSLERVLIVPAFERQVDRHYSRTRRCRGGTEVRN